MISDVATHPGLSMHDLVLGHLGKGLLFVFVTAGVMYVALRRALQRAASAQQQSATLAMQLEATLAAGRGGSWTLVVPDSARSVDDCELRISAEMKQMLGLDPDGPGNGMAYWLELVHPDDRDVALARARELLFSECADLELQYRVLHADGRYRTVLNRGRRQPGGRTWYGMMLDVSEIQRDRNRLALLGRLFESADEGIIVTDSERLLRAWNPAAQRLLRLEPKRHTGAALDDVLFSAIEPTQRAEILRAVETGQPWQGRVVLDTQPQPLRLSLRLSAIHDSSGRVRNQAVMIYDVTEIEQVRERIRGADHVDALTGLASLGRFIESLDETLERDSTLARSVHVLTLDLVDFNAINASYGQAGGDRVLRLVAERLRAAAPELALARLSANTFALALLDRELGDSLDVQVERLRRALAAPLVVDQQTLYLDACFGSSAFPLDAGNARELVQHAQTALHEAKREGRREHRRYTLRLAHDAQERLRLVAALRAAVEREALSCYFQPQVRLGDGRVAGAEALLRWECDGEVLLPGRFLAHAQEAGLMQMIGLWMLRTALAQVGRWLREHQAPEDFHIAVNVAQSQITETFAQEVQAALEASGVPARNLELEFTEDIVEGAGGQVQRVVTDLRALGVAIALDDFGTGYSSLARLKHLPVDRLKIDQTFVRDLGRGGAAAVISGMVTLGHSLGCSLTAEGVETPEQRDFLAHAGCDYGQGFLFGKAVPAATFLETHLSGNDGAPPGPPPGPLSG